MKIAVLQSPRCFEMQEAPIPEPAAGEVLVKVAACGVCTSDMEAWTGGANQHYPRFLGHEVSGTVVQTGEGVKRFREGDPVGCWVLSHGYAEYVTVKEAFAFHAGGVPLDTVMAEPLSCAVNAVEMTRIALADDVVIIGAGFMGGLVQKLAQLKGPRRVIVADTRADALERAARMGATHTVDVKQHSLPEVVKELTGGHGADISFEVTGSQGALQMLGDITRMSGKVAIVGFHQGSARQIPMGYWNWMAFEIHNAHFRDEAVIMNGMRVGMRLLTSGRLDLSDLITHRFPLEQAGLAHQTAEDKPDGFAKSVITF
jgi:2-desacetyl-2-hydroxyethyl bacteriochlorophyllide A dehydrogenase